MLLNLTYLVNETMTAYWFLSYLCSHETINDLDNSNNNGTLVLGTALLAAFLYRGNG